MKGINVFAFVTQEVPEAIKDYLEHTCLWLCIDWGVTSLQIDAEYVFPIMETGDYFKEGKIQLGEL